MRTFKTDMVLSRQQEPTPGRRRPLIVPSRRRRGGLTPGRVALLGVIALAVFLWHGLLGDELSSELDVSQAPPPDVAVSKGAPVATLPPGATGTLAAAQHGQLAEAGQQMPSVGSILLDIARQHVIRRVYAAWGSVMDLKAMRGADVDMLERGLAVLEFPLRAAVVRHRFQEPKRYGLSRQPPATLAERRRALTPENVHVFLEVFAKTLPLDIGNGKSDGWTAGDIVLFSSSASGRPLMAGVVSDSDDEDGIPLVITLDPRDQVALEAHSLVDYHLRHHYRLTRRHLERCSKQLELPPLRVGGALLL